jgi:FKBP-type peptidyl-prolyl cis-trans isomerase
MCRNYFSGVLFSISLLLFSNLAWADQATNVFTGKEYLRQNAEQEGVIVTRSGLQYEILQSGDGATPSRRDRVVVHYRGTFINGTEFDSSFKRNKPLELPADQVIKGWSEALMLMKEGDKWRLHIPYQLGYGNDRYGPIPPKSVLIFEVELLEVKKR